MKMHIVRYPQKLDDPASLGSHFCMAVTGGQSRDSTLRMGTTQPVSHLSPVPTRARLCTSYDCLMASLQVNPLMRNIANSKYLLERRRKKCKQNIIL